MYSIAGPEFNRFSWQPGGSITDLCLLLTTLFMAGLCVVLFCLGLITSVLCTTTVYCCKTVGNLRLRGLVIGGDAHHWSCLGCAACKISMIIALSTTSFSLSPVGRSNTIAPTRIWRTCKRHKSYSTKSSRRLWTTSASR